LAVLCTASIWWLAAAVARADTRPTNDGGPPTIAGIAQQGDTLTADPGGWSGDAPVTFTYAWSDGQTGDTITLSAADVGQSLTVTVAASNDFGQDSATSDSYGPVLPAPPESGDPSPVITGTPQQGNTLSVSNGSWSNDPTAFAYAWEDCDGSGNNCSPITGATSNTYTPQSSDVNSTIVASVTASNAGGPGSATSAGVGPVLPAAPVPGDPSPVITGTPQQGNTLSVSNGAWSNNPTSFSYAWSDGQTGSTITLSAADVGQSLTATVTASNAGGQNSATSDSYGPVLPAPPAPGDTPPVITGTPQQGNTLSVSNGSWSNSPTSFSYAWSDGQTGSTITLSAADVGQSLTATVTASNAGGPGSATSAGVGPVLPAAPTPGATKPGITGIAQQGNTLSVSNGAWSNSPTSFSYAWSDGQTGSTITLSAADVGQSLTATVTASNAGGQGSSTSASYGPVLPAAPAPGNPPPVISGTTQQGHVLSVSNGTWDNNPTGFSYLWEDCDGSGNNCTAITGATSSSYTLKAADVGDTIVAQVTASNTGGKNSATSASVGPVLPPAPTPGATKPGITGIAQQGHTLTASPGTWNNTPTSFGYAWQECDGSGNNCTPISGATSNSYAVQASDVGHKIFAIVTASNAGGQNSSSTALTTAILPAAPAIGTAPGITGTVQQAHKLTVSNGTWSNNPTGFAYAWQDCDGSGENCSSIGTNSNSYTLTGSDVGEYVSVIVTASNSGGHTTVTTASVGPVLPPPPANTVLPAIASTKGTVSVSNNGTWSNASTFTYAWQSCNASGAGCSPIAGATSSSYALSGADIGSTIFCVVTASGTGGSTSVNTAKTAAVSASDIPAASQPTTTGLLATPSAPVTNQSVTLIATVTAGTSSTALWGTVTFENGGTAIQGCANMPAVPSGRSATVACTASFAASSAHLSAEFTPASGSILKGSSSPGASLAVGPDASSTTLTAAPSVTVGASATYTAAVGPPASRPGPVQPTGAVEFLDGGTPIGSCANQPLSRGAASCTVSYAIVGAHQITARYAGDANFNGSSSPVDQVSVVAVPTTVLGTITATMQWAFHFTPNYTLVRNLVVNGVPAGAKVVVRCQGHGCPFAKRATLLTRGKRCGPKAKRSCITPGTLNLTSSFGGRHLRVGARITVTIVRSSWVGKSYRFTVRARRGPLVEIGSLPVV
jgi:hypothetical protein